MVLALVSLSLLAADPADFFEMKVRPVLAGKCHACHAAQRMGGLDLTTRAAVLKGGNSGKASVVASKPEESVLIQAVAHTHPTLKMPPGGKLSDAEIADLTAWVRDGAVWPEKVKLDVPPPAEYRISEKQRAFWSFQPVRKPAAASIDSLWLAPLREKGIQPNPPADRRTLIRRAFLDLTGLPPSAAEVEAFAADKSPDAFAKVVDRLLASPRYGERWGRYWLDVARYSDDQLASQFEIPHPNAFRYRDWVIQAFNDDMPYDTFVKAQFAGDQMNDPRLAAGTGFFSMSPEQQDDRVDAATRGFLGLTVACAQCHDHKFDPIPTRDYYSLLGVFLATKKDEHPLAPKETVDAYKAHQKKLEDVRKELAELLRVQSRELAKAFAADTARYYAALAGGPSDGLDQTILERWRKYAARKELEHPFLKDPKPADLQAAVLDVLREKDRIDDENKVRLGLNPNRSDLSDADLLSLPRDKHYLWRDLFSDRRNSLYIFKDEELDPYLAPVIKARAEVLRREVKKLEDSSPAQYPYFQTISDVADPKDIRVRIRGSADNLGEVAPRQFLQILSKPGATKFASGSGRRELGEAIASAENPLTARVIVNRVWGWHFGRGLVATASNFGQLGERPSHPELLDYLAARFVEGGWSFKKLHREIMLSKVYQLSSDVTPKSAAIEGDNRLLWRFARRRLDIESLRDAMLAATGELDLRPGGQPRRLNEEPNKRRTVYGFVSRRDLDPTLALFDFANPNSSNERRIETSTPLQRLFLLNSAFVERRAAELACSVEAMPRAEDRISHLYRTLFQRAPSKEETRLGIEFTAAGGNSWPRYAQVLLVSNEFVYVN